MTRCEWPREVAWQEGEDGLPLRHPVTESPLGARCWGHKENDGMLVFKVLCTLSRRCPPPRRSLSCFFGLHQMGAVSGSLAACGRRRNPGGRGGNAALPSPALGRPCRRRQTRPLQRADPPRGGRIRAGWPAGPSPDPRERGPARRPLLTCPSRPGGRLTFCFRPTLPTSGKESPSCASAPTRQHSRTPLRPRPPMRSAAAGPRGPAAAIEPRRLAAARGPGRHSLPRPERRGGGNAAAAPYPSAAPPPPGPGPGPPPSGLRSPPSASDCFGCNGNGGGAFRPGSRQLLGFGGPPRPFVVLLLPVAGPGAPPAAPARASPFGARASPPRSGVSLARPAPGYSRPACGPVYGPRTMSLKPQQQQQQPSAAASARKPGGGGLLTSPAAPPSSPSVSSSAPASSSAAAAASAGSGRPGLGRWVSCPSPLRAGQAWASHPLPRGPTAVPAP